jgi:hypothetical protein
LKKKKEKKPTIEEIVNSTLVLPSNCDENTPMKVAILGNTADDPDLRLEIFDGENGIPMGNTTLDYIHGVNVTTRDSQTFWTNPEPIRLPPDTQINAVMYGEDAQLNSAGMTLSIGFSTDSDTTVDRDAEIQITAVDGSPLLRPNFPPEIIEKAWKFAEDIMGIEHAQALKNGEALKIEASNGITYCLNPDGGIINMNTKESYCLQLWFKNGYERLPLPDILATKYIWITCLPEEVEKRANKFPMGNLDTAFVGVRTCGSSLERR